MDFDFIVVGAGSAGCAAARRLADDGRFRVALIEAGGRDTYPWIHVPVGYFKTMNNPRTDWCYRTEPDAGIAGRSIAWPRGKVLGGSSAINGLLYVRGQPQDYDHWRQLGNPGWSYEDVLPYFKRSENWEDGGTEERGGDGPLAVSHSRLSRQIVDDWVAAAEVAGYRYNDDYNSGDQEGVGYFQMTMRGGWRCSSATAYLRSAKSLPNLEIFTHALAEGIEFEGRRATGLRISQAGRTRKLSARHEVILCAGAIGSAQLLMLSGVGDGNHIRQLGGHVVHDLPGVGRNLQDHLQARPVYRCRCSTLNSETSSLLKKARIGMQFVVSRTGPMTMAASLGVGFLKTRPELATPDIQFHVQPFSADTPQDGPHKFDAFTASVCQLRPESAGEIRLKSLDPAEHPAIHPNYLATTLDCDTVVEGLRISRRIARCRPLADKIIAEYCPGPDIADDDYDGLLDWARHNATTIYHPTGTCKMGPSKDRTAVVDARLRVHGLNALRVADCSIMPRIVSGNTNAPAIMIGERVSDFVQEDQAGARLTA